MNCKIFCQLRSCDPFNIIAFTCIILIIISIWFYYYILNKDDKDEKALYISNIIRSASMTYLLNQYKVIFIVAIFINIIIFLIFGLSASIFFIVGVCASALSGFYNMNISTLANIRTVQAAKVSLSEAFKVSFLSGAAGSTFVNTLACSLLFLSIFICQYFNLDLTKNLLGLSIGTSLVSIFARLGGGIFTKGADVGADLVGKLEIGLPEDDIRNPAVIADNVGDNVGDCAGMSADLFESYIVSVVSSIISLVTFGNYNPYYPVLICAIGLFSCTVPIYSMRYTNVWKEMLNYFYTCCLLFCGLSYFFAANLSEWICLCIGIAVVVLLLRVTEYYTSSDYSPIKRLAQVSRYGAGNNIIYGLALSYESVVMPSFIIIAGILSCYKIYGISGIILGVMGIVAISPAILTEDLFGPITDNAGGIAQMSDQPIRHITDILDAVGNTTKAVTKGYAIGSAIFAAIVMFYLFQIDLLKIHNISLSCSISHPAVLCGTLFGAIIPYLFSGFAMKSVGIAASQVVQEVRSQVEKNPGILDGSQTPDYHSTIKTLTNIATKEMIIPSLLPIIIPTISYLVGQYTMNEGFLFLAYCLIGTTIGGSLLSMTSIIAGGAWDNAKKYIEMKDGKSDPGYAAAVIGDTVGDPLKDTSGPSINSVMKLVNFVCLVIIYAVKMMSN